MSYIVDSAEGLKRNITLTISKATLEKEVEKNLKKLQSDKNFKLQGFRPGHIPLEVVRQYRGADATQSAVQKLVDQELQDYSTEKNETIAILNNISYPTSEGDVLVKVEFDIFPELSVSDLSSIEIKNPKIDVESSIDEMIEILRQQRATLKEVDRASQEKDEVLIDFSGYIDGEEFEGGKSENYRVQLGQGTMIPEFEAALIGKKAGEEFEAPVTFPEDYHAENLKGKQAVFKFKLHSVSEKELPEVTPSFIAQFFEKGEHSLERLRNEVRKNIEREIKLNTIKYIQPQIDAQLVEQFKDQELPESLIENKAKEMRLQQVKGYMSQLKGVSGDLNLDSIVESIPLDEFKTLARNNLILEQAYKKIVESIKLEVGQAELDQYIDEISIMFEHPVGYKEEVKKDQKLLQGYLNNIANNKLVNYIVSQAKLTDQAIKYQELIAATQPQR